ncbi:bacteriocin maturation protein [Metabacillus sp. GX 13764]|uniref:bacteriocin maturation protein n=1 Tax=Metabacillus kandeliae TaxID=2900151 RepID=UPI001E56F33A|nr:bacteriocin maturation protein [Metabacillus kandeliae]MCD7034206.1 bacteriocin maturation protein [Metabacillus kandeliae]
MANLNPSARLKVNRDTLYIPDPSGGVYFRNNESSFKMEGSTISQWVERLMPLFNGERRLDELTNGLTPAYRERVLEIAEVLLKNGYVRDTSYDRPHRLTAQTLKRYSSQVEFLDAFGGSGAARFEEYRQSKVLAAGSGPFFVSLIFALLESGHPSFSYLVTDSVPTDRGRLNELIYEAGRHDPEVSPEELNFEDWESAVQPFDAVLYVSGEGNIEGLKALRDICRQEGKILIPALFTANAGMAGPILYPGRSGDLERALQTLQTNNFLDAPASSAASAMLANLIAFEWLKEVTGVKDREQNRQFYVLNPETLEGRWHSFWNEAHGIERSGDLLQFFSRLASSEYGVFRKWDEGSLEQLPLSLCRVQPVSPDGRGLLPEITVSAMTHEEARREAGLLGAEAFAEAHTNGHHACGAGGTWEEAAARGLEKCLQATLLDEPAEAPVYPVVLREVSDEECSYYLQVLKTAGREPVIGLGQKMCGFPVVWAGSAEGWSRSTGLTLTEAVRSALLKEAEKLQLHRQEAHVLKPFLLENSLPLSIPSCSRDDMKEILSHAEEVLKEEGWKLHIQDVTPDPIFQHGLAGIAGVSLRKEGGE